MDYAVSNGPEKSCQQKMPAGQQLQTKVSKKNIKNKKCAKKTSI